MILNRKLEVALNVAIVATAVALVGVLVNRHFLGAFGQSAQAGAKIAIAGVSWDVRPLTVVLAISSKCGYCTESAPFYRRLAKDTNVQGVQLVAVSQESVDESRRYLSELGVKTNTVVQAKLGSLGIDGTPTLLLVDAEGRVKNRWVGKVPPAVEEEVLGLIWGVNGAKEIAARTATGQDGSLRLSAGELKRMMDSERRVTVVDVRSREEFARGHIPAAANIPYDEVHTRAADELAQSELIVISHLSCNDDEMSRALRDDLLAAGFSQVVSLKEGVDGWKKAGFKLEASAPKIPAP